MALPTCPRTAPLFALVLLAAAGAQAQSSAASCTLDTPEHFVERSTPGALKRFVENVEREDVVTRSYVLVRPPVSGTLEAAISTARREEQEALSARADFEQVRDFVLEKAALAHRVLVFRYRVSPGGPVVLRYHAVFSTGFRVLHVVAESQAALIDSRHTPYAEVGLHEPWMLSALATLRCGR